MCVRGNTEEEDEVEVEGTNETWSPHFNTYKGIRETLEVNGAACRDKLAEISVGRDNIAGQRCGELEASRGPRSTDDTCRNENDIKQSRRADLFQGQVLRVVKKKSSPS